jgi:hypothetical protein
VVFLGTHEGYESDCYEHSLGVEECQYIQDEISNNVASWLLPKHAGELSVYYRLTDVLAYRLFCGSNIYLESWFKPDPVINP